jgi:hypothetical protein
VAQWVDGVQAADGGSAMEAIRSELGG